MNGCGLIVIWLLAGQLNLPNLPGFSESDSTSRFSAQAAAYGENTNFDRDYGWEIDENGELCFIVQVSPVELTRMEADNKEKASPIPPELVGRVTRFVVRYGDEILPRKPSLDEIQKSFPLRYSDRDAVAITDPRRLTDIDSPVVNVQGSSPPPTPNFGTNSNNSSLSGRLPSESLLDSTRGGISNSAQDLLNRTRNNSVGSNWDSSAQGDSERFQNTAPRDLSVQSFNGQTYGNEQTTRNSQGAIPNGQDRIDTSNRFGPDFVDSRGGQGYAGQVNSQLEARQSNSQLNFANPPMAYPRNDPYALTQNQGMYNGQLGYQAAMQNNTQPANGSGQGNYSPQSGQPPLLIANNTNPSLPTQPNSNNVALSAPNQMSGATPSSSQNSPSDDGNSSSKHSNSNGPDENLLPRVMLVASLSVNGYLGYLLRKLYHRYRSLLSNMRGQLA
ncbi:MAG: hypothetical protein KDB03_03980 [Planctomycetales bacterium]|nr:hypothetical protein [Planctomycetales bacterium]